MTLAKLLQKKENLKSMLPSRTVENTSNLLCRFTTFSLNFHFHLICSLLFTMKLIGHILFFFEFFFSRSYSCLRTSQNDSINKTEQKVLHVIRKRPTVPLNKLSLRNLEHKPKGEQLMPWSQHLFVSAACFKVESDWTRWEARAEKNLGIFFFYFLGKLFFLLVIILRKKVQVAKGQPCQTH